MTGEQPIVITEPATIRGYTSGGKGGYGSSSTPLHRLTLRMLRGDQAACGAFFTGKISVKPAGRDGRPGKADAARYGVCQKCWPVQA